MKDKTFKSWLQELSLLGVLTLGFFALIGLLISIGIGLEFIGKAFGW